MISGGNAYYKFPAVDGMKLTYEGHVNGCSQLLNYLDQDNNLDKKEDHTVIEVVGTGFTPYLPKANTTVMATSFSSFLESQLVSLCGR
jgi:hypothetical protein